MGYYRDGEPVAVEGLSDAIFDTPQVRGAQEAVRWAKDHVTEERNAFVWIALFQPTKAELAAVASIFELDAHQVEDAGNSHQRAKADVAKDETFALAKVLTFHAETHHVDVGQIAIFRGPSYLVTVRHGTTRDLREVRNWINQQPEVLRRGPSAVMHAILDRVVDGYLQVAEQVQNEVERLEEKVFSPRVIDVSGSIYLLKRENLEIRRAVTPLLGVATALAEEGLPGVPDDMLEAYRNLGEQLLRVADQAEQTDSLLLALMAAANAKIDLQQSADQRRMAAWAALALIPTVVGSIYGMNFVFMPELEWRWGYPVVVLVVVVVLVLVYRRLRQAGWL